MLCRVAIVKRFPVHTHSPFASLDPFCVVLKIEVMWGRGQGCTFHNHTLCSQAYFTLITAFSIPDFKMKLMLAHLNEATKPNWASDLDHASSGYTHTHN